jgi:beta-N-acetylhexosaminidase
MLMAVRTLRIALAIALFIQLGASNLAREKSPDPSPRQLQGQDQGWAETTLGTLSAEEKVGQLFMIRLRVGNSGVRNSEYLRISNSIRLYHIGSLAMSAPPGGRFVHNDHLYQAVVELNRLQQEARVPLLVAGDFEQGVLPAHLFGTTVFPHAMAFGAAGKVANAEEFGRITAQESRAIGVHWNLFPVADVNSNPANPIIGTRAFGANPEQVGELVAAYIRGARSKGMLTTAKHFPGHGNTGTDSHLALASVDENLEKLRAVDLPPFRKAIEAGVDAVMTAHIRVPALDPDPNVVATTSPAIVTGLLKNEMGFKGIVITDALDMAGLTRLYAGNVGRAAVDAFKAGSDVLTMPADLDASYRAVVDAVRTGEISEQRLDASVLKILRAKASLGLDKTRLVDITAIPRLVGNPENAAIGQRISDDSITLVRDNGKLLPLKAGTAVQNAAFTHQGGRRDRHPVLVIVLCDNVRAEDGRVLEREIRSRMPDANLVYVDPRVAPAMTDDVLGAVAQARRIVVAVYIVPSAARSRKVGRGGKHPASLPDSTSALFGKILAAASERTAVLAMGNPYLTDDFPAIQNYICTFSNVTVSEISAARALFGEIPMSGQMPVNLASASLPTPKSLRPAQVTNLKLSRSGAHLDVVATTPLKSK